MSTPDGLLFGATCTGTIECRTGLACIKYPGAGHGYCAAQCDGANRCPKAEGECINFGICAPSCADGCPADTTCAEGHCIPGCKNRKDICGSKATCTSTEKISFCIGDEPPVETCKPPTTTPTSGVSQSKTIAATTAA